MNPIHNAQHTTRVACLPFCVSKRAQKQRTEMLDAHCLEVRKHKYRPFVHVSANKMAGALRVVNRRVPVYTSVV